MEIAPVVSHHDAKIIMQYLKHKKPFLVEGGPGIGKSLAVSYYGRQVYRQLRPDPDGTDDRFASSEPWWEPLKIDITEDTEVRDLLGEIDLIRYFSHVQTRPSNPKNIEDFFVPGPLTRAITEGRLLIVEELDRAGRETLFSIFFDPIEYRRVYVPVLRTTLAAREDSHFNMVITVNRFTDIGTVSLPKAFLRRLRRVHFYDPSQELNINRWQTVQYEARIVMANVGHVLDRKRLSRRKAETFIMKLLDAVIFRLRAARDMDEVPTPAETAMWFLDMLECDGERLLDQHTPAETQLEICLEYRGAIVKSASDDARFIATLADYFLG